MITRRNGLDILVTKVSTEAAKKAATISVPKFLTINRRV